jgi:2-oxoglutarate dehydrogenase E1 component
MEPAPVKPPRPRAKPPRRAAPSRRIVKAAGDSIRAMLLIRTYRVRGHLAANLDPLGLSPARPARGSDARISRLRRQRSRSPGLSRRRARPELATVREIVDILRANYCGNVGLEYMHIADVEERRFLQERMEGKDKDHPVHADGKKAILSKVIEAEQWEKFLGRKYVGTKRFGLDGGEAMIPAMEAVIKYGGHTACARSCMAWRIAAGSTCSPTSWPSRSGDLPRIRRRLGQSRRRRPVRAT